MEIYITNGNDVIQLPVLPESLSIETSHNIVEVNIQSKGDVELVGKRKVDSVSISSFFPNQACSFERTSHKAPYDLCEKIKTWQYDGDILSLQITGTKFNKSVVIEAFSYGEQDRTGDVFYTIGFKEYRTLSTARVAKKKKKITYTCKKGDTFYSIARKFTGNSSNATKIAKQNKMKVSAKLKKGKKLVITYET